MRKTTLTLLALLLCAMLCTAVAEAPQSQFGFSGWPYRRQPPCRTQMGDAATQQPTCGPDCQPTATPAPSTATHVPPAATRTPAPTQAPIVTVKPTATPAPTKTPAAVTPSTAVDYTTTSIQMQEQKAWNLLSADRAANGLAPLTLDPVLCRLARMKSEDMRDLHYFAHESPTYGHAKDMLTRYGYAFTSCGENIAHHATVEKSQAAFLSSADHRRNMLSSAWTKVGIGVAYDAQGFVYLTQIFAR